MLNNIHGEGLPSGCGRFTPPRWHVKIAQPNPIFRNIRRNLMPVEIMSNPTIRWPGDLSALPRISIVTPCYNHVAFIEATLLSVLEQGYPNLEYIVMDGGSTDGSAAIIEKYASYLTHWQSQPDRGQYDAINQGFQRSTGEIMGWINSDDMLHRNALWTAVEIFQAFSEVEWLMGFPMTLNSKGAIAGIHRGAIPRWSRRRFLKDCRWIQQESVLWRRTLWARAGGYVSTQYAHAGDLELWARFFRHAKLYTSNALIGGFRVSANQKTRTVMDKYMSEAQLILANETCSPEDRAALARIKFFDRYLSFAVRKFYRIRRIYEQLLQVPPVICYNRQTDSFEMQSEIYFF
jgi:glycosyltransferase involved in cell wall biosynthesis